MESGKSQIQTPQKVGRFSNALVIYAADFPIYYIECISERHFVIAGGGGSSKTGVHNQIDIIELVPSGDSCAANLTLKYKTPKEIPDAIMTGSLSRHSPLVKKYLITGGTKAAIYHIDFDARMRGFSIHNYDILDSSKISSEVKSVKYLPDKVLTGGVDGQLTLWQVGGSARDVERQIKAHSKEISEIDVDLVSQQVVTLSRDEIRCAVWSLVNFELIQEFKRETINPNQDSTSSGPAMRYTFRSCRYAYDALSDTSKRPGSSYLLVACNPIPAKGPSKLFRWSTSDFKKFSTVNVTNDGVMAMNVSQDGRLVAIGTRSGCISIFEVRNLRRTYNLNGAHHNAVTNLEFLVPKPESFSLTNSKSNPLLSVSIDRRIVLHRPGRSSFLASFLKTALLAFLIYVIFFLVYKNWTTTTIPDVEPISNTSDI